MKREDLRAIEGLTEEQINEIMRLHGQDASHLPGHCTGPAGAAGHRSAGTGRL